MSMTKSKSRQRRKLRIRKKISGTAERPRLSVFRSARHMYAQVIDDRHGVTLASASTLAGELKGQKAAKLEAAKAVGQAIGKVCTDKGIKDVVFDRNGFLYHGRVQAVAEGAREAGLNF